jgi:hypothetical protein
MWKSYPPAAGNFVITPGAGYMAVVTADTWYSIVGSHNKSAQLGFLFDESGTKTNMNVFSLPYHTSLVNAAALKTSVGGNCSSVKQWQPDTQMWKSYPQAAGNFVITPGAGYMVVVTADTTWQAPANDP